MKRLDLMLVIVIVGSLAVAGGGKKTWWKSPGLERKAKQVDAAFEYEKAKLEYQYCLQLVKLYKTRVEAKESCHRQAHIDPNYKEKASESYEHEATAAKREYEAVLDKAKAAKEGLSKLKRVSLPRRRYSTTTRRIAGKWQSVDTKKQHLTFYEDGTCRLGNLFVHISAWRYKGKKTYEVQRVYAGGAYNKPTVVTVQGSHLAFGESKYKKVK